MSHTHETRSSAADRRYWAGLLIAVATWRLTFLRSVPFNSDEPQHLHVAWAWAQGLVPYRGVFDNHAPLFHLLYAPLLRLLGETPDVLLWMRLAMLPLALLGATLAAVLARGLWDRRVALAGVALVSVLPAYLAVSSQFRADGLWGTLWLATLCVALGGEWSARRGFWTGLLLGATFAASLKTSMLLAGFAFASASTYIALPRASRPAPSTLVRGLLATATGLWILPTAVVAAVAVRGGLPAMYYGVIQHNLVAGLGAQSRWTMALASVALGALPLVVRGVVARAAEPLRTARRCIAVGSAVAYVTLMYGFWPLWTRQDLLPVAPLLMIGIAAVGTRQRPRASTLRVSGALVAAGALACLVLYAPTNDRLSEYRATLADVLATTSDADPVMDDKGAAIFRSRPYYFALENVTMARIARHLVVDDIVQRLVATDTHVVWATRLPVTDQRFVDDNYLPARHGLRIAGHDFGTLAGGTGVALRVLLPGEYALLGDADGVAVDARPYREPLWLAAGVHTLSVTRAGHYALAWRPAARIVTPRSAPGLPRGAVATASTAAPSDLPTNAAVSLAHRHS